jgi:hypothetical protein
MKCKHLIDEIFCSYIGKEKDTTISQELMIWVTSLMENLSEIV